MRNHALDLAKLIASFFIISVHVGFFREFHQPVGEIIRVSSRWALPFFFLASGYLMGMNSRTPISTKVNKLLSITIWASIIYLPVILLSFDFDVLKFIGKVASLKLFTDGVYFHLWFMNALIAGVLLTGFMVNNFSSKTTMVTALVILVLCWASDVAKSFGLVVGAFELFRTLIGFSLVYVGAYISSKSLLSNFSKTILLLIVFGGIALMMFEVISLNHAFNTDMRERQFPLMSVPVCLGILALAENIKIKDNVFSRAGRDYSLGIYLLHPLMIYVLMNFIGGVFKRYSSSILVGSFVLSLIAMFLIKKYIPSLYNKMNGIGVK